ncbi:MAG: type II toxin-antitoxin system CcdA family antitoxin [Rhizobiaceae bacterium]
MTAAKRKPTNLSIDSALVRAARDLDVNVSRAAEEGIAKAVAEETRKRWKDENRSAIEAWNAWVKEKGLPLASLRQF